MGDLLKIEVETRSDATVLRCVWNAVSSSPPLREKFDELADSGKRAGVFDVRGVRYLDSGGLAEIVSSFRRGKEEGIAIRVVASERHRRLFEETGLTQVLGGIYSNVGEALENLEGEKSGNTQS